MPLPAFDIYPYVGPLPLRFEMRRDDVPGCLGVPAKPFRADDWFGSVRVGYTDTQEVADVGFGPREVALSFLGKRLWDDEQIEDPMPSLLQHDAQPLEFYGFIVFLKIGVTCTGFHDDNRSQRAITVFRRGLWDRFIPKARSPDLSRYRT
jgi:hypothetical protein